MMIEPFDPDPKLSGENYLKRRGRRYKKSTLMKYFKLLEKRRAKKLEEQQERGGWDRPERNRNQGESHEEAEAREFSSNTG